MSRRVFVHDGDEAITNGRDPNAELVALARSIVGIESVDTIEPMLPFACNYCGCLVSAERAQLHRSRCAPEETV